MRSERNKDGSFSVWMTRDEYHELPRAADTFQREIAIRLMGDCGLRVAEVLDVEPRHISRKSDGTHYDLEVVSGKDTTGEYEGGKHRETWLPRELEALINRYCQQHDVDDDQVLIDRGKRTVQYWVEQAAERAVEETGDEDYRRVSTHDLRRCWANHLLVEENVSPRIVMALGGWSSYDAIEPYLAAPTEENIIGSMSEVSL
ncbi:site-specific integrase [Haloarchaeobius iranensis]|uniref:Phage integrase family protein n=1 Tax=Haloarchaeobius iranensis TaxID=996166 RepID=A0A1G9YSI6_9EURY|nr:site-specific integrase [Haloarchaeobius iranensis]SDN12092.1 Phage integrase family protein [Haloarchaeobius iranensis]